MITMALSSALIIAYTYVDTKELFDHWQINTYVCLFATFVLGLTSSIAAWHFFPKKPARTEVPLEFQAKAGMLRTATRSLGQMVGLAVQIAVLLTLKVAKEKDD